jgi:glycosyltransferase involved in cell wall biosynthesis
MLLSSNRSERLPNAVKEAIACRCICITTRTPGIEELAAHPHNPLVVEQGDWKAAAELLIDTQDHAERYMDARDLARAFLLRNFDSSALIKRRVNAWLKPTGIPV